MTSGWSSPTWHRSSTESPRWWQPSRRRCRTSGSPRPCAGRAATRRPGRARAVPLQPAVRGPLRGRRSLRCLGSAGKRLFRVEVSEATFRRRNTATVRGETPGSGPNHHRPAGLSDAAGHPAEPHGVRAGAGAAGEEVAPLPAVPGRAGSHVTHLQREEANGTGPRGGTPKAENIPAERPEDPAPAIDIDAGASDRMTRPNGQTTLRRTKQKGRQIGM